MSGFFDQRQLRAMGLAIATAFSVAFLGAGSFSAYLISRGAGGAEDLTRFALVCVLLFLGAALTSLLATRAAASRFSRMTSIANALATDPLGHELPAQSWKAGQGSLVAALFRLQNAVRELDVQREAAIQAEKASASEKLRAAELRLEAERKQAQEVAELFRVSQKNLEAWRRTGADQERVLDDVRSGNIAARVVADPEAGPRAKKAAAALNEIMDHLAAGVVTIGNVLAAMAKGDMTGRISGDLHGILAQVGENTNLTAQRLEVAIGRIEETSELVTVKAAAITEASGNLANRTETSAQSLAETAASLDQITKSVRVAAESAGKANAIVESALAKSEHTSNVVGNAVSAMREIEEQSNEISRTVQVINEIAFQTNLLALNAGVEAARAGESGRGFAVVASEVRALALRAANSAGEIDQMVARSTLRVKQGVDNVGEAGAALNDLVASVNEISGHVSEIAFSANLQLEGIEEINGAVAEIDKATQENAAMFEETTAVARSLSDAALEMTHVLREFTITDRKPRKIRSQEDGRPSHMADRRRRQRRAVQETSAAVVVDEWQDF